MCENWAIPPGLFSFFHFAYQKPTYRYKLSRPGWQNEISQAGLQLPPRVLGCVLVGLFLDVSALLEELQIFLGIGEYSKSAMI